MHYHHLFANAFFQTKGHICLHIWVNPYIRTIFSIIILRHSKTFRSRNPKVEKNAKLLIRKPIKREKYRLHRKIANEIYILPNTQKLKYILFERTDGIVKLAPQYLKNVCGINVKHKKVIKK